jgi:hypothetical protein
MSPHSSWFVSVSYEDGDDCDEVASRLGYRSSSALYNRFPELCCAITARHLEQYNIEHLRPELEAFLDYAVPSPSLGEVAKHLGCPAKVLRNSFPELCRPITRQRRLRSEPIDIEGLRAALERELLSNEEPRSMRQVAKDRRVIGCE